MSSNGIDYSKWDKIDCSSSDEEEEDLHAQKPRVTRMDTPSTITRTSDGNLIIGEKQQQAPPKPSTSATAIQQNSATSTRSSGAHPHAPGGEKIQDWSQNGGVVTTQSGCRLYWSQDRYAVCLRLSLPSTTIKGKDLQVELNGLTPFQDRFSAVGSDHVAHLKLKWTDPSTEETTVLLEGDFPHAVHATEDDELDWDIDRVTDYDTNEEVSFWAINLQKAVPMEGVIIWWRRPLTQFEEIDTRQVNPEEASKAQAFQKAWDEAHRQFREKMQQKKDSVAS